MTTNTNTKASTKAEASAEAKAKATAAKLLAEASAKVSEPMTEAEQVRASIGTKATVAEHLAMLATAVTVLADTANDATMAVLNGRRAIGAKLWDTYTAKLAEADANTVVPEASTVTFTKLAAAIFPATRNTKDEWTADNRPVARSWASLAEDWGLFTVTSGDRWIGAYRATLDDASSFNMRGYLTFTRQAVAAEAEQNGQADDVTPQAKGSATKRETAKAKAEREAAEVKRQADAKAKRDEDTAKAKADDEAKAKADKDSRVAYLTANPKASVVTGFAALSAEDLTSCRDAKVLAELAATVLAWRDVVLADEVTAAATKAEAEAEATKASTVVADGQAKAEAKLAEATEAEASEAGAEAKAAGPDLAELLAAAKDLAAAIATATAAA